MYLLGMLHRMNGIMQKREGTLLFHLTAQTQKWTGQHRKLESEAGPDKFFPGHFHRVWSLPFSPSKFLNKRLLRELWRPRYSFIVRVFLGLKIQLSPRQVHRSGFPEQTAFFFFFRMEQTAPSTCQTSQILLPPSPRKTKPPGH